MLEGSRHDLCFLKQGLSPSAKKEKFPKTLSENLRADSGVHEVVALSQPARGLDGSAAIKVNLGTESTAAYVTSEG